MLLSPKPDAQDPSAYTNAARVLEPEGSAEGAPRDLKSAQLDAEEKVQEKTNKKEKRVKK
jgi:hypothetical protein